MADYSAGGGVKCPDISIAVQYTIPETKSKKIICGYRKNGYLIKHGQESEFDKAGNLKKIKFYNHDIEGPDPEQEKESFEAVQDFLRVLLYEKMGDEKKFQLQHCDLDHRTWVKTALTSNAIQKTYSFRNKCDISGTFTASFLERFPMRFKLRNLGEFTKGRMLVKMRINQQPSGIRYEFDVLEGALTGTDQVVTFIVHYEVDVDPLTGKTKYHTQDGRVTLTRVGDRLLHLTKPLLFKVL